MVTTSGRPPSYRRRWRCADARPRRAQGRTDFGAWLRRRCLASGRQLHRYIFTVYALKTDKIDVPADATAALVGFMINANKLGKASFEAKYGRSK